MNARASGSAVRFPDRFLVGAATAAHQVEGNNRASDWWEYEERGLVPHRSAEACRHFELFELDFDLARALGHNAHRFSIEWSRIEPRPGQWDAAALDHYRDVAEALTARGLEPIVTLHHFTNPAWFLQRGGWTRSDAPLLFARYVEQVMRHLGGRVRYWLTINEPTVYVLQGYVLGVWPPRRHGGWGAAARVLRNFARAHVAAYETIHRYRSDAMVGFAHSAPVIRPCNPHRARDRFAAAVRDAVLNRAFFWLLGGRRARRRRLDYIGINYYTRNFVRSGSGLGALFGRACTEPHHADDGPVSSIGWEVFPAGLALTLKRFASHGVPLIVTENGIATDDEGLRCDFVRDHVAAVGQGLAAGVNVIGYLYWSLMDNFEWAEGTHAHFGLAAVDYATQRRTVRPAAEVLARACRPGAIGAGRP